MASQLDTGRHSESNSEAENNILTATPRAASVESSQLGEANTSNTSSPEVANPHLSSHISRNSHASQHSTAPRHHTESRRSRTSFSSLHPHTSYTAGQRSYYGRSSQSFSSSQEDAPNPHRPSDVSPREDGVVENFDERADLASEMSNSSFLPSRPSSIEAVPPSVENQNDLKARLGRYKAQLQEKIVFPDHASIRFVPSGTTRDFFVRFRVERIFLPLWNVRLGTGPARDLEVQKCVDSLYLQVQSHLSKTLATVVFTKPNWEELNIFLRVATAPNSPGLFCDANLPLSRDDCIRNLGEDFGDRFFLDQFIFSPATFDEGKMNNLRPNVRLPILERRQIGEGAFGEVYRLKLARGGWRSPNGSTNNEDVYVVQKVFKQYQDDPKEAFETEERNHRQLLDSPTTHKHIVRCLGSLIRSLENSMEYSLFFELADGSIEDILSGSVQCRIRPADLFDRLAEISGALSHLHTGLMEQNLFLAGSHLDLRPANIFRFDGARVLKLGDLGLSKVKRRGGAWYNDWTPCAKVNGTFVAPEVCIQGQTGFASDLWSLGAVIIEVTTFAVGGFTLLRKFRTLRSVDDDFGRHDKFFTKNRQLVQVNRRVWEWCKFLEEEAYQNDSALGSVVEEILRYVMTRVLVIDREVRKRTTADNIRMFLYERSKPLKITNQAKTENNGLSDFQEPGPSGSNDTSVLLHDSSLVSAGHQETRPAARMIPPNDHAGVQLHQTDCPPIPLPAPPFPAPPFPIAEPPTLPSKTYFQRLKHSTKRHFRDAPSSTVNSSNISGVTLQAKLQASRDFKRKKKGFISFLLCSAN
jgi:serine/threonine protein kinase